MSAVSPFPYGLGWDTEFCMKPIFNAEPDLKIITRLARQHLHIPSSIICKVSFLAEGALNKVYKIEFQVNGRLQLAVFRVALPLDIPDKVESEVATLAFVQQHTDLPTPKVYAYDSTNRNDLRFPWILMEFIEGKPLCERQWKYMSWDKKVKLVKQLALYQSQLYKHQFDSIGSLHPVEVDSPSTESVPHTLWLPFWAVALISVVISINFPVLAALFCVMSLYWQIIRSTSKEVEPKTYLGTTVSLDFLWANADTPHGPFNKASEWLRARLVSPRQRQEQAVWSHDDDRIRHEDENTLEQDEKILLFTNRLIKAVPDLFTEDCSTIPTLLHHQDLNTSNVLIDKNGDLAGIIDWEYVKTAPIWEACKPPKFLEVFRDYSGPPIWQDYPPYNDNDPEELKEGVNCDYWEHKQFWEEKQLSILYVKELERLEPAFIGVYEKCLQKREFLQLVSSSELGFVFDGSEFEWLKRFERGQPTEGALESGLVGDDTDDEGEPLVFHWPSALAVSPQQADQENFDYVTVISACSKKLFWSKKLSSSIGSAQRQAMVTLSKP